MFLTMEVSPSSICDFFYALSLQDRSRTFPYGPKKDACPDAAALCI